MPHILFIILIGMVVAATAEAEEMNKLWGDSIVKLRPEDAMRGQLFTDGNYAMFIHWGLYAHLSNNVEGKTYYGIGEWIMHPSMATPLFLFPDRLPSVFSSLGQFIRHSRNHPRNLPEPPSSRRGSARSSNSSPMACRSRKSQGISASAHDHPDPHRSDLQKILHVHSRSQAVARLQGKRSAC
jgi:Sec-independent protein translocase protein TatA